MLQALLASGALFQGIKTEISAKAQRIAFMVAMSFVALIFFSIALIAFSIAGYFALIPYLGEIGAVCTVGGVATVIGAIFIMVGTHDRTAKAATTKKPNAAAAANSALPGITEAVGTAPVPWLMGALALGMFLARKR